MKNLLMNSLPFTECGILVLIYPLPFTYFYCIVVHRVSKIMALACLFLNVSAVWFEYMALGTSPGLHLYMWILEGRSQYFLSKMTFKNICYMCVSPSFFLVSLKRLERKLLRQSCGYQLMDSELWMKKLR